MYNAQKLVELENLKAEVDGGVEEAGAVWV